MFQRICILIAAQAGQGLVHDLDPAVDRGVVELEVAADQLREVEAGLRVKVRAGVGVVVDLPDVVPLLLPSPGVNLSLLLREAEVEGKFVVPCVRITQQTL